MFPSLQRSCSPKAANAKSQDNLYVSAALKNKLQRPQNNVKHDENCNMCSSPAKSRQLYYNILHCLPLFKPLTSKLLPSLELFRHPSFLCAQIITIFALSRTALSSPHFYFTNSVITYAVFKCFTTYHM